MLNYILLHIALFISCRLTSGAQLHTQGNGATSPHRSTCHIRHHHLRDRRARVVLRQHAQDVCHQWDKWVGTRRLTLDLPLAIKEILIKYLQWQNMVFTICILRGTVFINALLCSNDCWICNSLVMDNNSYFTLTSCILCGTLMSVIAPILVRFPNLDCVFPSLSCRSISLLCCACFRRVCAGVAPSVWQGLHLWGARGLGVRGRQVVARPAQWHHQLRQLWARNAHRLPVHHAGGLDRCHVRRE